jgi:hypothetical protein
VMDETATIASIRTASKIRHGPLLFPGRCAELDSPTSVTSPVCLTKPRPSNQQHDSDADAGE